MSGTNLNFAHCAPQCIVRQLVRSRPLLPSLFVHLETYMTRGTCLESRRWLRHAALTAIVRALSHHAARELEAKAGGQDCQGITNESK